MFYNYTSNKQYLKQFVLSLESSEAQCIVEHSFEKIICAPNIPSMVGEL